MLKKFISVFTLLLLFIACSDKDSNSSGGSSDGFDRATMLTNLADNLILPAYEDLDNELNTLVASKDAFIASPDQSTLIALKTQWLDSYKKWQYVEMFNIGLAESTQYAFQMNVFPTNILDIDNNISTGTYDLTATNNQDAVGFPAVEYLLNGAYNLPDSTRDATVLASYTTDTDAENRKAYLSALVNRMQSLTGDVLNNWTNGYRDTFIAGTANTATSPGNKMINDFIFYYEKGLRANKFGIPAGVFSNDPLADRVEGYYSKENSKALALESLQAVQDFFNGDHYIGNGTGSSYASYLVALDRTDLVTMINAKLNEARTKIQTLDANLHDQVINDFTQMTQTYDILQQAVVLLKVDMLQAFNVSVDFQDADGD